MRRGLTPPPGRLITDADLVEMEHDLSTAADIESAAVALGTDVYVRDGVAYAVLSDAPGRSGQAAQVRARARRLQFPKRKPRPAPPEPRDDTVSPIFPREGVQ